jgi:hypothetical protein
MSKPATTNSQTQTKPKLNSLLTQNTKHNQSENFQDVVVLGRFSQQHKEEDTQPNLATNNSSKPLNDYDYIQAQNQTQQKTQRTNPQNHST